MHDSAIDAVAESWPDADTVKSILLNGLGSMSWTGTQDFPLDQDTKTTSNFVISGNNSKPQPNRYTHTIHYTLYELSPFVSAQLHNNKNKHYRKIFPYLQNRTVSSNENEHAARLNSAKFREYFLGHP